MWAEQSRDSVHDDDFRNSVRQQAQHPIGESLNHLMQTAMTEVAGLYGTGGPGRCPGADDVFEKAAKSIKHLDEAMGAGGKQFGRVADDVFAGSTIGRHADDCLKNGTGCFVYDTEVARGWDVLESPVAAESAWDATWLTAGLTLAAGTGTALVLGEPRASADSRRSTRRHVPRALPLVAPGWDVVDATADQAATWDAGRLATGLTLAASTGPKSSPPCRGQPTFHSSL